MVLVETPDMNPESVYAYGVGNWSKQQKNFSLRLPFSRAQASVSHGRAACRIIAHMSSKELYWGIWTILITNIKSFCNACGTRRKAAPSISVAVTNDL
jgi:hypothetical protein